MSNRYLKICAEHGTMFKRTDTGVLVIVENGTHAKADLYECGHGCRILAGFGTWLPPDTGADLYKSYIKHYPKSVFDFHAPRNDKGKQVIPV